MIRNTNTIWGWMSQLFHWAGAALVLVLIIHGWWMTEFAPRAERIGHYGWHASLGYFFLALMIARLLWRWLNTVPALPEGSPAWERLSAQLAHWGLYLLMFAASVSGWALVGTFRSPLDTTLFGWVRVPAIVSSQERALHGQLELLHSIFSWALPALVVIHIASALYHLWFRKDDVMQRMLPSRMR